MAEVVKKPLTEQEKDQKKRKILFNPCKSKQELHKWIQLFLEIDFPDCIVDPDSNSSPMDMVFEVYSKALNNNDPSFNRVLYFSARTAYKTLGAAILEVLAVLHLNRDVAHMAALEGQSRKAQSYVKAFFSKKVLRDFKVGNNLEQIEIARYYNKNTNINLNISEFKHIPPVEQDNYEEIKRYIKIVVCTMAGANSEHTSFMVVDEVDVVRDRAAYQQAKAIPDGRDGQLPITMLTSTRKFSFGLVQDEIDNAVDREGDIKLHIRHWNIIDVTERCPPERCLPEQPKIPIYVDEDNLMAIGENKYDGLTEDEKNKYKKDEGFQGCISNCKLFSACRGRLHTIQKSKSKLLKTIDQVTSQFRNFKLEMAQAELLCRKPSKTGLIYSNLERSIHMKTAAQMAEMLLGTKVDPNFTKKQLIALFKERDDWKFYTGMDFGFSHFFAFATGAADGYRCFIIDAFGESNLMPDQIVNACNNRLKYLNPTIFGDPEDPGMVAVLKSAGFKMKKWIKGPGSLTTGIDTVKLKLREPMGEATLFFLAGDPGVEELFKYLSIYHWKLDPDGETLSNDPDDKDDDLCDALRYLVMNKFSAKRSGAAHMSKNDETVQTSVNSDIWTKDNMFSRILEQNGVVAGIEEGNSGNENGIKWSF